MTEQTRPAPSRPEPTEDQRMGAARRLARWYLGDSQWADMILNAYRNPEESDRRLSEEQTR